MTLSVSIGIRKEDKSDWERRAPLTPDHIVRILRDNPDVTVCVEPSEKRVFADGAYEKAGATVSNDLSKCNVILGVKEVPKPRLQDGQRYVFFSHTIKGQPYNMALLQRILDLKCTLIDYELIKDNEGRRLIFFSRHAGYAGTIDTLWALGKRLAYEGYDTPLGEVRMSHEYADLKEAKHHLQQVAALIRSSGLPSSVGPIVVAFTGEGNVSAGAQEVFDLLPHELVAPQDLAALTAKGASADNHQLYKVLLPPAMTVDRREGGPFDWDEYVSHPERYEANMGRWLDHITALVHGIYWEERYPRLLTKNMAREMWSGSEQPRLRVIGDISCDIEGSIEVTVKSTTPGDPAYVYNPATDQATSGVAGHGPVIMAVDNLPSEIPVESSEHFGNSLLPFVVPMAQCDWSQDFAKLSIPREIKDAIIAHHGELTPSFTYLNEHLMGQRKAT